MIPRIFQLEISIIVTVLVASSLVAAEPKDFANPKDPCTLALFPHQGTAKEDLEIIRLQTKVRDASNSPAWLEQLGWAFIEKARVSFDPGFYKMAEQCALCLEEREPGCAEGLLLRAYVLNNLHKFKEAEQTAQELVKKRGLHFDYGVLGDALMEQGKLDAAVVAYQAMMDQKPSPQSYSRAAHLRWLKGDLTGAITLMSWAAGVSNPRAPESTAWTLVRLGRYEWEAGDLEKAIALINQALAFQAEYPPALLEKGRILLGVGKMTAAIESLKRAAALNPLPEYQWTLSEALHADNRLSEATAVEIELKRFAAANDPRTFSLYLATRNQDVSEALRLAKSELATRADVFTFDALAWAWIANGNTEQAWIYAQRAVTEGTLDGRLLLHAGVIASAAGQNEKAATYLEQATTLQQMLLPSERQILTAAKQAIHPSFGSQGVKTTQQ